MKKHFLLLLATACVFLGFGASFAVAQDVVMTGTVAQEAAKDGSKDSTVVILSDQTNKPVTFYGLDKAKFMTVDGSPARPADLQAGMKVTVHYMQQGGKWYVSQVVYAASPKAVPGAMPAMPVTPAAPTGDTAAQDGRSGGTTVPVDPTMPAAAIVPGTTVIQTPKGSGAAQNGKSSSIAAPVRSP